MNRTCEKQHLFRAWGGPCRRAAGKCTKGKSKHALVGTGFPPALLTACRANLDRAKVFLCWEHSKMQTCCCRLRPPPRNQLSTSAWRFPLLWDRTDLCWTAGRYGGREHPPLTPPQPCQPDPNPLPALPLLWGKEKGLGLSTLEPQAIWTLVLDLST